MRAYQKIIVLFILSATAVACGTGPWFVRKNIYDTYKNSMYSKAKKTLRYDGYYMQIGELKGTVSVRDVIIFNENGYFVVLWLLDRDLKNEIKKKVTTVDTIKKDLGWWKVENDSLILEHYAENKNMMSTWKFYDKGKIIDSSYIELQSEDIRIPKHEYKFVQTDSLPIIYNKGRYLKKDWYQKNLHHKRRKID